MAPGEGTHERTPQAGGPGTDNVLDTQLQRKERIPGARSGHFSPSRMEKCSLQFSWTLGPLGWYANLR